MDCCCQCFPLYGAHFQWGRPPNSIQTTDLPVGDFYTIKMVMTWGGLFGLQVYHIKLLYTLITTTSLPKSNWDLSSSLELNNRNTHTMWGPQTL